MHELRTPISAIMGFSKINRLTDELGRDQRVANSAAIERNCEALLALIDQRLDRDRREAVGRQPDLQASNPDTLIADVMDTTRALAGGQPIELTVSIAPDLPPLLLIDAPRLRQVLLNLLGNAVKFTARGEVRLRAGWAASALTLSVEDTGIGIPPEAIERIWQPWQQVGQSVSSAHGGSGLGLAIARELVQVMGGTIELTSRPGQGTRLDLRLPAAAVPCAAEPTRGEIADGEDRDTLADGQRAPSTPGQPIPSGGASVLIAEDNADLRDLLSHTLRQQGMKVVTAADGLEATEAARVQTFDLIVLDLEMPLLNGFEAAQVLRLRGFSGPLAGLSARLDADVHERGQRAGFDQLLDKPIHAPRLHQQLAALLARHPR
jgi:CheY-like chemotaxis protein